MRSALRLSAGTIAVACALGYGQVPHLSYAGAVADTSAGVEGLGQASMAAESPDGKFLYVTSITDCSVSWFAQDSATGSLDFGGIRHLFCFGWVSVAPVTLSPDGRHVYVTTGYTYSFSRDSVTGALSDRDSVPWVVNNAQGNSIEVSPDGRHLYLASSGGSWVLWVTRDSLTGKLTYGGQIAHEDPGVDGLSRCNALSISPNGKNVYVVSDDSILSVFDRDTVSGALTQSQYFKQGENGVTGLEYCYGVEVTPDGKYVYASSGNGNSVVWFTRDATTGFLTYSGILQNQGGELDYPWSMGFSPDGLRVYVYLINRGRVSTFTRNAGTGALTLLFTTRAVRLWPGGPMLNGQGYITPSLDGRFLYQTSMSANRVLWYRNNFSPTVDARTPDADTVALAEGDSVVLKVGASDADPADIITYAWVWGDSVLGTSDSALARTTTQSPRIDSVKVALCDGFDTTWQKWILLCANVAVPPGSLSPADKDTVTPDSSFTWQPSTDPDLRGQVLYRLQVALDSNFTDTLINQEGLSGSGWSISGIGGTSSLPELTVLYWRLAAYDNNGYETSFSAPAAFVLVRVTGARTPVPTRFPSKPSVSVNCSGGALRVTLAIPKRAASRHTTVEIRDLAGRLTAQQACGPLSPGMHTLSLPARNAAGIRVATLRIEGMGTWQRMFTTTR